MESSLTPNPQSLQIRVPRWGIHLFVHGHQWRSKVSLDAWGTGTRRSCTNITKTSCFIVKLKEGSWQTEAVVILEFGRSTFSELSWRWYVFYTGMYPQLQAQHQVSPELAEPTMSPGAGRGPYSGQHHPGMLMQEKNPDGPAYSGGSPAAASALESNVVRAAFVRMRRRRSGRSASPMHGR